jgi:hypothetical protein
VRVMHCEVCDPGGSGATWHQDGQCLRCARVKAQHGYSDGV